MTKDKKTVAWQTRRRLLEKVAKKSYKVINNKLYDLNKKPFLKHYTPPTKEEIKELQEEIKHNNLLKKVEQNKQQSTTTDHEYYRPKILQLLRKVDKNGKRKAYTYDSIAKNINYKIIDKDDKKYFISIISSLKKIKQKQYEGMTFYYKL